jgi:hypothetical protein
MHLSFASMARLPGAAPAPLTPAQPPEGFSSSCPRCAGFPSIEAFFAHLCGPVTDGSHSMAQRERARDANPRRNARPA